MYLCEECEAEFDVVHDQLDNPEYCPFCSFRLVTDDDEDEEDEDRDWYPDA